MRDVPRDTPCVRTRILVAQHGLGFMPNGIVCTRIVGNGRRRQVAEEMLRVHGCCSRFAHLRERTTGCAQCHQPPESESGLKPIWGLGHEATIVRYKQLRGRTPLRRQQCAARLGKALVEHHLGRGSTGRGDHSPGPHVAIHRGR